MGEIKQQCAWRGGQWRLAGGLLRPDYMFTVPPQEWE